MSQLSDTMFVTYEAPPSSKRVLASMYLLASVPSRPFWSELSKYSVTTNRRSNIPMNNSTPYLCDTRIYHAFPVLFRHIRKDWDGARSSNAGIARRFETRPTEPSDLTGRALRWTLQRLQSCMTRVLEWGVRDAPWDRRDWQTRPWICVQLISTSAGNANWILSQIYAIMPNVILLSKLFFWTFACRLVLPISCY